MDRFLKLGRFAFLVGFLGVAITTGVVASPPQSTQSSNLQAWLVQSISDDQAIANRAIDSLRALGPEGLAAFRKAHAQQVLALAEKPACLCEPDSLAQRVAKALDQIAGQRDAASSGLYWFTDLAAAQEWAHREGKPILSLHMLGKLTEELSCANSRFFRTTLYSNHAVSSYLSQSFVLHWETVRSVPKITVDFGDGRRLERTITGNSAHFILDQDGQVIDVLPGLYAPQAFLLGLQQAVTAAKTASECSTAESRRHFLAQYHRDAQQRLTQAISSAGPSVPNNPAPGATAQAFPDAREAMRVGRPKAFAEAPLVTAVAQAQPETAQQVQALPERVNAHTALTLAQPKSRVEAPLVNLITRPAPQSQVAQPQANAQTPPSALSEEQVTILAALPANQANLSPESQRLVRAKIMAVPAKYLPGPASEVQQRAIVELGRLIAVDTARNEYDFHRRIHSWLGEAQTPDRQRLNDRIYAELFLTPLADPWMGLLNIEAFSAIDAYGVIDQH